MWLLGNLWYLEYSLVGWFRTGRNKAKGKCSVSNSSTTVEAALSARPSLENFVQLTSLSVCFGDGNQSPESSTRKQHPAAVSCTS